MVDSLEVVQADIFVSLITVGGKNNDAELEALVRESVDILRSRYSNFELILVDNGLQQHVLSGVQALLHELPCIRIIRLARDLDFDTAVFSGLEAAIGDYVAVFEAGVDPVDEVPRMIGQLISGADIVQGVSELQGLGLARRVSRSCFFWLSRFAAGLNVPKNATYLSAFSRRAVNAMASSPAGLKYLRHLLRHIGFEVFEHSYARSGARIDRNRPGVMEAIEVITNYSLRPLRAVAGLGMLAAVANLIYAVYVLMVFFSSSVARGWTTTNLQLALMFFILFLALAVITEYLGRILSESRRGPSYIVMEELVSSSLIADEGRRNIVS